MLTTVLDAIGQVPSILALGITASLLAVRAVRGVGRRASTATDAEPD